MNGCGSANSGMRGSIFFVGPQPMADIDQWLRDFTDLRMAESSAARLRVTIMARVPGESLAAAPRPLGALPSRPRGGGVSRRARRGIPHPDNWDQLAGEWHPTRNGDVTLYDCSPGSSRRVWWRCPHGHDWAAAIGARVHGSGCPYCAHRGADAATPTTCLGAVDPQLASQWHPTRNDALTADGVLPWSGIKVWWRCAAGHEWRAAVAMRRGHGCPYCSGQRASEENNLAVTEPDIAVQWHPTRNGGLSPREVTATSGRRFWWRCEHGHEWRSPVCVRKTSRGCPMCVRRRPSVEHNLALLEPAIAAQWHPTLNGTRRPEQVAPRSHTRAWWRCVRGHVWQAAVVARTKTGSGCPVCARDAKSRARDPLTVTHPDLAAQWHPELNGDASPEEITYGSTRKAWWLCSAGHSWAAQVGNRSRGAGCPYCAGKLPTATNNLAVHNPALAAQWHPSLNRGVRPADVTPFAGRKSWWLCPAGHEWASKVADRNRAGHGCPYCAGHLATPTNNLAVRNPALAARWHPTRNGTVTPADVTVMSSRRVHWLCSEGHAWQAVISNRGVGVGCPYCAGKLPTAANNLAVQNPALAGQWHPTRNGSLTPADVTPFAGRRIAWLCACGYQWTAALNNRQRASGCPGCQRSPRAAVTYEISEAPGHRDPLSP